MVSPTFSDVEKDSSIHPIYHATSGLTSANIESAVKQALRLLPNEVGEPIPKFILDKYDLASLDFAIRKIHFPENSDELQRARERLVLRNCLCYLWGLGD